MIERATLWPDGSGVREPVNDYGQSHVVRRWEGQPVGQFNEAAFRACLSTPPSVAPAPIYRRGHIVPTVTAGEPLPRAPFAAGSDTSFDAAVMQERKLDGDEARIMALMAKAGEHGSTCDEAGAALGLIPQTCSARFNGLERAGLIRKTERKRMTRNCAKARVYCLGSIRQGELGI